MCNPFKDNKGFNARAKSIQTNNQIFKEYGNTFYCMTRTDFV